MVARKVNTMKLGTEVEGRLKGLYTLFMSAEEAKVFFDYHSLKERALPKGAADNIDMVRHVYISDPDNTLAADAPCLLFWSNMGMPITLEVTAVIERRRYPRNVGFMLNIRDSWQSTVESFWHLLPTDQVKFSQPVGSSHRVMTVTVENMTSTEPHEFKNDISFVPSKAAKYRIDFDLKSKL